MYIYDENTHTHRQHQHNMLKMSTSLHVPIFVLSRSSFNSKYANWQLVASVRSREFTAYAYTEWSKKCPHFSVRRTFIKQRSSFVILLIFNPCKTIKTI